MAIEIYKQEESGNVTFIGYVWQSEEGKWSSQGLLREDRGTDVRETKKFPPEKFYMSKECAGDAIWTVLKDSLK